MLNWRLVSHACWSGGNAVLDAVSTLGAAHDAGPELYLKGMRLLERDVNLIPMAYSELSGGAPMPHALARAAAAVVWRLKPFPEFLCANLEANLNSSEAWSQPLEGSAHGRIRGQFKTDAACLDQSQLVTDVPTLVCSLVGSLREAGSPGEAVLTALSDLAAGGNVPWGIGSTMQHGGPACKNCPSCLARRGLCASVCDNEACPSPPDASRKFCARCRRVSYCSPECQAAAWKRHKLECAPAPGPPA